MAAETETSIVILGNRQVLLRAIGAHRAICHFLRFIANEIDSLLLVFVLSNILHIKPG